MRRALSPPWGGDGTYLSKGCRRPKPAAPRTPAGLSSLPRRSLESKVHKSWGETERQTDRQTQRPPRPPQHARCHQDGGTRTLPQLYKPRGDVTAVPPSPPDEVPSLTPPPLPSPGAPSPPASADATRRLTHAEPRGARGGGAGPGVPPPPPQGAVPINNSLLVVVFKNNNRGKKKKS